MSRRSTSVACPAFASAAALALATNSVSPQGVSLGTDPALVGKQFAIYGCLDSGATASSPNLVPVGLWTPTSTPPGTPAQAPGQPVVDGWPTLFFVRLTAGSVTGNIYGSSDPTSLAVAPASINLANGSPPASILGPLTVPEGATTRLQLNAAATTTDAVDLWVGDADLTTLYATSTTATTAGAGSKTFTTQAGKGFLAGMAVRIAFSSTVYMDALVTTYSGTTLVVAVQAYHGSGTGSHSAWSIIPNEEPPGYRYFTRLHGGGNSVQIGIGTKNPSGLYVYASVAAGTPSTLYAQGIAGASGGGAPIGAFWVNGGQTGTLTGGSTDSATSVFAAALLRLGTATSGGEILMTTDPLENAGATGSIKIIPATGCDLSLLSKGNGKIEIDSGTNAGMGACTVNSGTGAVNIGTGDAGEDTDSKTISIGTGSEGTKTIRMGNQDIGTAITILFGGGGLNVAGNSGPLDLSSDQQSIELEGGDGAVNVIGGTAITLEVNHGTINVGSTGADTAINIGGGTGVTPINIFGGTGAMGITSAGDINVNSTTGNVGLGTSTGNIGLSAGGAGHIEITPGTTGNISLVSVPAAGDFKGMQRGIFIGNRTAIPTGNPVGGGFLYVVSGALTWKGSTGTVTTIAPA